MRFRSVGVSGTEKKQRPTAAHIVPPHLAVESEQTGDGVRIPVGIAVVQTVADRVWGIAGKGADLSAILLEI